MFQKPSARRFQQSALSGMLLLLLNTGCRHTDQETSSPKVGPLGLANVVTCSADKSAIPFSPPISRMPPLRIKKLAGNTFHYLKFCENNLYKQGRSFCDEKSCDLTFFENLAVSGPIAPGINLVVKAERQIMPAGQFCSHSLTVGVALQPVCLGKILSVTAFAGMSFAQELDSTGKAVIKPYAVGAAVCSNPLFTLASAVDQEGITPLNIRASRDLGGTFQHGKGVNIAAKKIKWTEVFDACRDLMCKR